MKDVVLPPIKETLQQPIAVCSSAASVEQLTGLPLSVITDQVSTWMRESSSMLPKSSKELQGLVADDKYIFLVHEGKVVAGCGTTFAFDGPTENGHPVEYHEVGGLVVSPDARKNGFGTAVAVAYVQYAQSLEEQPTGHIVFVNGHSSGIFIGELGATPMNADEIVEHMPRSIYTTGCATCPNRRDNWDADKDSASMQQLAEWCCDAPCRLPARRQ